MYFKQLVHEWLEEKDKKEKQKWLLRMVLSGAGVISFPLARAIVLLVLAKYIAERFFGPLPVGFVDVVLGYVGFRLLCEEPTFAHAGNLAIKFAGLPYVLSMAWVTVLPLFWTARPAMEFEQVWLGYVGIYAVATVLSQALNPKQVL